MIDVDLVVMWVDGSDPEWLEEKSKYDKPGTDGGSAVFRFRDFDLMKYWFRAIEKYLPWFRTVHFVTWGHLPAFLNTSHPKLNIVNHRDFMPEGTLPCFNSCALEMNLYRIKGLAEHFVYFNDDTFVLRPMKKSDFFDKKGNPCCQFTEIPPIHKGYSGTWQMHAVNDICIINRYFQKNKCQRGKFSKYFNIKYNWYDNVRSLAMKLLFPNSFVGFKTFHIPAAFRKRTFETIWEKETPLLTNVSGHKFRSYEDVNQWLAIWWQLAEGEFCPRRADAMSTLLNRDSVDRVCEWITGQKFEMICINDDVDENSFSMIVKKLQDAFDTILPDKCSYEL